jgi:hypothetical protein
MTTIHGLASVDDIACASGRISAVLDEYCLLIGTWSHVDAVATGPRGCISVLNGRPRRRRTCPIVGIATVCCDVEVADATVKWIVKKRLAGAGNLNSTRAGLQRGAA